MELRSNLIRATVLGLVLLGIGGRVLMRVVAEIQGQPPILTLGGTVKVVFYGAVSGAFAGLVYSVLGRFVGKAWLRIVGFFIICGLVAWRGVNGQDPLSQWLFMALALVYLVIVDVLGRRSLARSSPVDPELDVPTRASVS